MNPEPYQRLHRLAWLFVGGFIVAIYLPRFVTQGLCFDGMTYACVARNMAIGIGSWWEPYYASKTSIWIEGNTTDILYGQLPMLYWLESLFFKAFGDHWWIEKVYGVIVMLGILTLVVALWRQFFQKTIFSNFAWLPVFLLCITPHFRWAVANNIIEPTLTLFCTASVFFAVKASKSNHLLKKNTLLAGVFVALAFLTKGPVGLFPVVVPVWACLVFRRLSLEMVFKIMFWLLLPLAVLGIFLWCYQPAHVFFNQYLHVQILDSLAGKRWESNTSAQLLGRLFIFQALFFNLLNPGLVLLGIWAIKLWINPASAIIFPVRRISLFWCLIGLSATLPFVVSIKQAAYYVVPAMPFWVLGISALIIPTLSQIFEQLQWGQKTHNVLKIICFVASIGLTFLFFQIGFIGKSANERQYINKLKGLEKMIPEGSLVGVPTQEMIQNPWLNTYLQRYHRITLTTQRPLPTYCLVETGKDIRFVESCSQEGFQIKAIPSQKFMILRKPSKP